MHSNAWNSPAEKYRSERITIARGRWRHYNRAVPNNCCEIVAPQTSRRITATSSHAVDMTSSRHDKAEASRVTQDSRQDAERNYEDILQNLQEGVFQTTPEGGFITANRALVEMLGFASQEELIESRQNIARQHYVNPEDREKFKRQLRKFGKVPGFEFEAYRKDGSRIWLSENTRAVFDSEGVLIYYEGTAQDITERKQAESALRESEQRYRELFENSRDAIYVHDMSGRYTSVNRAAEELSGFSRHEIIAKHYSNF